MLFRKVYIFRKIAAELLIDESPDKISGCCIVDTLVWDVINQTIFTICGIKLNMRCMLYFI